MRYELRIWDTDDEAQTIVSTIEADSLEQATTIVERRAKKWGIDTVRWSIVDLDKPETEPKHECAYCQCELHDGELYWIAGDTICGSCYYDAISDEPGEHKEVSDG